MENNKICDKRAPIYSKILLENLKWEHEREVSILSDLLDDKTIEFDNNTDNTKNFLSSSIMIQKYAIDMAQKHKKFGIEFDGPNHYLIGDVDGNKLNMKTILKRRILKKLGWNMVYINYKNWDINRTWDEKIEFLQNNAVNYFSLNELTQQIKTLQELNNKLEDQIKTLQEELNNKLEDQK